MHHHTTRFCGAAMLAAALTSGFALAQQCPGPGSCFEPNGTPGCEDALCCDLVCQLDPFCCDGQWDEVCVNLAQKLCNGGGNDFDQDGMPDEIDPCPFVFNPGDLDGMACSGNVTVEQVTMLDFDGSVMVERSEYGLFGVHLPAIDQHLYLNVVAHDQWVIANMTIFPTDPVIVDPFPQYNTHYDLGVARGMPVDLETIELYLTPQPLPVQPFGAPVIDIPVNEIQYQVGTVEGDNADPPPAENFVNDVPDDAPAPVTKTRPGFEMVDLDDDSDNVSCAPGAVASSFSWLNKTYCLGCDWTLQQYLDDLKTRMGVGEDDFPDSWDIIVTAKKDLVKKKKWPITVEFQGTVFTGGGAVSVDDLYKQMCLGQDIELHYKWTNGSSSGTHTVALIKMTKTGDEYEVTVLDDSDQDGEDGNDRERTGKIVFEDGKPFIKNGTWKVELLGWTAESPTLGAILNAITSKINKLSVILTQAGDNGGATEEQVKEIKRLTELINWLTQRVIDFMIINLQLPDTSPERQEASLLDQGAANANQFTDEIVMTVGDPIQLELLDQLAFELELLLAGTQQIVLLLPPDQDFDDIPDDIDNCPLPNPDQSDLNGNGIGDVCELDENDCNNNAIPDDFDIDSGLSQDANGNGIPDECEKTSPCPGDTNGDGSVDVQDLTAVILDWGTDGSANNGDADGDGIVTVQDLTLIILSWGACP